MLATFIQMINSHTRVAGFLSGMGGVRRAHYGICHPGHVFCMAFSNRTNDGWPASAHTSVHIWWLWMMLKGVNPASTPWTSVVFFLFRTQYHMSLCMRMPHPGRGYFIFAEYVLWVFRLAAFWEDYSNGLLGLDHAVCYMTSSSHC